MHKQFLYEETRLWRRAFAPGGQDRHEAWRANLVAAYRRFWANTATLTSRISAELPGLTLHDESHLLSVWERADQIAGDDYIFTPLDAFLFGGAVLLHDAAHAVAAYPGGLDELKRTPQWRDAVAIENPGSLSKPDIHAEMRLLFQTVREVHAQQAERLAFIKIGKPCDPEAPYLLEDRTLREHLGTAMGLIAASHHWQIGFLEAKLPRYVPVLPGMAPEWASRPIRLACLLRCADALQIDQSRAPDFLMNLLQLRGVSADHWKAQNRLGAPTIDAADDEAVVISSFRPFAESDADAWWVARDAVLLANDELRNSSVLLKDLNLPVHRIRRVRDAESTERLSTHIKPEGWRPISAEVKISSVGRVVDMFGGAHLYSRDPCVPLRELIQNASDAIARRKALEGVQSSFSGEITIRLDAVEAAGATDLWLRVEDDGLGMSEGTITGPLLDFGCAYSESEHIRREHPGLAAARPAVTGRFGVGFFSAFMIARRVEVTSRSYTDRVDARRTLKFRSGLTLRPLLLEGGGTAFTPNLSTQVSILISRATLDQMLTLRVQAPSASSLKMTFAQLVAHICPTLDCDVYVQADQDATRKLVHASDWDGRDRAEWLGNVTLAPAQDNEALLGYMRELAPMLRLIDKDDRTLGLAAVNFKRSYVGISTIGGLISGSDTRRVEAFASSYGGVIASEPDGPSRQRGPRLASDEKLSAWATEQAHLLSGLDLPQPDKNRCAQIVAEFGGAPGILAVSLVNREYRSLEWLVEQLTQGREIVCPVADRHGSGELEIDMLSLRLGPGSFSGLRVDEIDFANLTLEMVSWHHDNCRSFRRVADGPLQPANSLLALLAAAIPGESGELFVEMREEICFGHYLGKSSDRDGLLQGAELRERGCQLSLRKL